MGQKTPCFRLLFVRYCAILFWLNQLCVRWVVQHDEGGLAQPLFSANDQAAVLQLPEDPCGALAAAVEFGLRLLQGEVQPDGAVRLDVAVLPGNAENAWGGEDMSNELTHNPGQFDEVIHIIDNARSRAMKAVNAELIQMYWEIGSYVSGRVKDGGWGKSVVADFSEFLQAHYPGTKGFSAQNIWRMKQFYETYCDNEKLSPLVREIPWTSNLLIMTGCKTDEAREFYLRLCIANRYTKRELDRQIGSMLYERTMISHEKHKDLLAGNGGLAALRDSYVFEFLDLEEPYKEKDLRRQIVSHLKDFILEFGHDFTFVGEEYRVQVGNTDFFIDLLFYNRALSCLVAIELKIDTFRPEHLGQLNFYLEALDRDVKKPNENPSVGLVLCTGKDDTVVEYALSRSMSPTMVADYTLHLPDKAILQSKLRELTELALEDGEDDEGDEE